MNQNPHSTKIILAIMLLCVVLLVVYIFVVKQREQQADIAVSPAAQALENATGTAYQNLSGQPVALTEHLGKVIVVYSWASWCPQCLGELSQLADLASRYDQNDVVVLAINRGDDPEQARRFLAQSIGTETKVQLILDTDDYFYNTLAGYSMPETIVFSQTGTVAARYRQNFRLPVVVGTIDSLLDTTQPE